MAKTGKESCIHYSLFVQKAIEDFPFLNRLWPNDEQFCVTPYINIFMDNVFEYLVA